MALPKKYFNRKIGNFYRDYKEVETEEDKISLKQYRSFIRDFFDECFIAIMTTKMHLTMPFGLGDFYLKERPPTGFYATSKTLNRHTFGKCFEFKWDSTYAIFQTLPYIKFRKHPRLKKKLRQFYRDVKAGRQRSPQVYSYPIKTFTKIS